jgi:hypothetical protein
MASQVEGSQAGEAPPPPPPPPNPPRVPYCPAFNPADEETPSRAELVTFTNAVRTYVGNQKFLLQYLGVDETQWPPDPITIIPLALSRTLAIWRTVADIGVSMSMFDQLLAQTQVASAQAETATACATSSTPPQAPRNHLKTPMPT